MDYKKGLARGLHPNAIQRASSVLGWWHVLADSRTSWFEWVVLRET
jgi:hypothetical protein